MVAAAVGMQTRGWKPFASSFGAFLSRAYDFVRMAAISDADLKLCGSHVGVSIGPDGPSQMALEDIASLRAVLGSVVLYPATPTRRCSCSTRCAQHRGISYMRTTREATPVHLRAGGDLRDRRQPHAALRRRGRRHPDRRRHHAARMPRPPPTSWPGRGSRPGSSTSTRSSRSTPRRSSRRRTRPAPWSPSRTTGPEGGIGETVAGRPRRRRGRRTQLSRLAVTERPGSGPPADLLAAAGIDAAHIVAAARAGRFVKSNY